MNVKNKSELLLEAIGNISDDLIVEANPEQKVVPIKKDYSHWIKYFSLAACFCICILGFRFIGSLDFKEFSSKEEPVEAPMMEETCEDVEAPVEEPEAESPVEEPENESPAEEPVAEESRDETSENVSDGICVIQVLGNTYHQITLDELRLLGVISPDETAYQIKSEDIGECIGMITDSSHSEYIGDNVYHYTKYPDSDSICILNMNGDYTFFIKD